MLAEIEKDVIGCSRRYGREFKVCGRCGKGLTRLLSRALGIGPVCAAHLGMSVEEIDAAKQVIIDAGHDPEETIG